MHFPIICIEKLETSKEEWVTDLNYDDRTLNENTDYYGEMYSQEDRLNVIRSKWLKELFDGYGVIDARSHTITFYDYDKVTSVFENYLINKTEELHDKAIHKTLRAYELHLAGVEYKDCSALFYADGYGQTSFDFIDDIKYRAGQTFRIGNIFDAHI